MHSPTETGNSDAIVASLDKTTFMHDVVSPISCWEDNSSSPLTKSQIKEGKVSYIVIICVSFYFINLWCCGWSTFCCIFICLCLIVVGSSVSLTAWWFCTCVILVSFVMWNILFHKLFHLFIFILGLVQLHQQCVPHGCRELTFWCYSLNNFRGFSCSDYLWGNLCAFQRAGWHFSVAWVGCISSDQWTFSCIVTSFSTFEAIIIKS